MNKLLTLLVFSLLSICLSGQLFAQSYTVGTEYSNLSLADFATKAEAEFPVRIFYDPAFVSQAGTTTITTPIELGRFLQDWLSENSLALSSDHR